MPRGNRMGPMGQGPMTGRGAGFCAGNGNGFGNGLGNGSGFGAGGGGFGRGYRFRQAVGLQPVFNNEEEAAFLENRKILLSGELEAVNSRLASLKDTGSKA